MNPDYPAFLQAKPEGFPRAAHTAHSHRLRPLLKGFTLPPATGFVRLQAVQNFMPKSSAIFFVASISFLDSVLIFYTDNPALDSSRGYSRCFFP
jgi:hypothetical protein